MNGVRPRHASTERAKGPDVTVIEDSLGWWQGVQTRWELGWDACMLMLNGLAER